MTTDQGDAARKALDLLEQGGWRVGAEWRRAHETCQAREGQAVFDRIHALCHRIEGDDANARYWYARTGVTPASGSFEDEAAEILSEIE